MSYIINYPPINAPLPKKDPRLCVPVLSLCFFAVLCLLVSAFWQEGALLLRQLLLGRGGESFLEALEVAAQRMEEGSGLKTATVFALREVLGGH